MCMARGDALVFYFFEVFSEKICAARGCPSFLFSRSFLRKKCVRANIFSSCGKDEKKNVTKSARKVFAKRTANNPKGGMAALVKVPSRADTVNITYLIS